MTCLQRWDGGNIAGAAPGSQWVLMLGRYWYDDNPFIGTLANINMWSRTELQAKAPVKALLDAFLSVIVNFA